MKFRARGQCHREGWGGVGWWFCFTAAASSSRGEGAKGVCDGADGESGALRLSGRRAEAALLHPRPSIPTSAGGACLFVAGCSVMCGCSSPSRAQPNMATAAPPLRSRHGKTSSNAPIRFAGGPRCACPAVRAPPRLRNARVRMRISPRRGS